MRSYGNIKFMTVGLGILMAMAGIAGCAGAAPLADDPPEDCLQVAQNRLDQTPAWDCLPTLDDQCIPLAPLFALCDALWPDCVVYPKFYLWQSEIKTITSQTPRGPVQHRIRIYHNTLATCRPQYHDPLRTHGDVAEFYDPSGRFMGLGVYMGQGLYVPLGQSFLPANPR